MLTKQEIQLVQADWDKVEQDADRAGSLIYDRLFQLDPGLRALFTSDLEQQKSKLVTMIGSTLYGLSDPDVLMPIVRLLGHKHVRLGVKNEDYATVGAALIWTLKQTLGDAFGPENEAAWIKVYGLLAEAMKAPA